VYVPPVARLSATPLCAGRVKVRATLLTVALAFVLFPASSQAATFSASCASDLDVGTCQRADYVAQAVEDEHRLLGWIAGIGLFLVVLPTLNKTFRA
jgi:hypothetical protein